MKSLEVKACRIGLQHLLVIVMQLGTIADEIIASRGTVYTTNNAYLYQDGLVPTWFFFLLALQIFI